MPSEFLRRHRVSLTSVLVVAAAVIALVAYALSVPGYAAHRAEVNDGGVWVTKGDSGVFARFNKPISQLDGYSYTENESGAPIDIEQEGSAVVAVDRSGALYPVDVSKAELIIAAKVPIDGDARVAVGGGTVAVVNGKGELRAVAAEPDAPLADLRALAGQKPLAAAGTNAGLAVGDDGSVYVASATKLVSVRRTSGGLGAPEVTKLSLPGGADVTVTVVGSEPVVLAHPAGASTATVRLPNGETTTLPAATDAVLQQAGPADNRVLVATSTALLAVALDGGTPTKLASVGGGSPAAPTLLGGCLFAAWAGAPSGDYATACSGDEVAVAKINEASSDLVFRVNRDKILLNDRKSGAIWNLDSGKPKQVDNWKLLKPRNNKTRSKDENTTADARPQPPKPKPDELGARPGRTTSLYVLDNDSDPSGGVLAVSGIRPASKNLSVSPDGQTVDVTVPPGATQPVSFQYTINGAKGVPVSAPVTVALRAPDENAKPTKRVGKPHAWTVPASGTVTIPVLNEWRDNKDGDTVVLSSAKVAGGAVSTTSDGQLIFTAPDKPGTQTIDYVVSDGHGETAPGSVAVTVQAPDDDAVAPTASPDYARGQVGKPITIQPLANDLPGSDPLNPSATLALAGNVASPAGAEVTTDLTTGTVTVRPRTTRPVKLSYQAKYGDAPTSKNDIVVQVDPATRPQPPVTAADTAVVHGQTPVVIDVLANDADPAGNLLVVQRATAARPDDIEVAVIDGRYLRLRSKKPQLLDSAVQSVTYHVSNGSTGEADGGVTITQLPASDEAPVTLDDYVRVRTGQPVGVAVLDNDVSPSGSPLTLSKTVYGAPSGGQLTVRPASAGTAFVSGRVVRFVAGKVSQLTTADVSYVAEDLAGNTREGTLHVTIVPPRDSENPNQDPSPPPLEGRATAGQTIRIKLPASGVDPDGDPVVITGLDAAPKLGRVLGTNARGIEYQAYPFVGNGGTDTFRYVVTDIYGATAVGTARVAVVDPGEPQPPVAVDDTVTTTPNTRVQVDVLANDLAAPGDRVTVLPLSKTDVEVGEGRVKLAGDRGPITVTSANAKTPVQFSYTISNGLAEATAQVTVRALDDANLPPLAFDQYPPVAAGATSVDVDLVKSNVDPDGGGALRAVTPTAADGKVNLKLGRFPQTVPYVIADAKGATATAVIYLPAIGNGAPMLKPGSLIRLDPGQSTSVDVRQFVVDPAGKPVRLTVDDLIETSPARYLSHQKATDSTRIPVTAAKGYNGPAALSFQVTNGKSLQDPKRLDAVISVPVQIGDDRPVLRCPDAPLEVTEGGKPISLRPATYCHAWVPKAADLDTLPFSGSWQKQPAGVTLSSKQGVTLGIVADSGRAQAGATGVLRVSARGAAATLPVNVVKAKPLEVSPLTVDGVEAGRARVIDLRSSLRSYLAQPSFGLVGRPTVSGAQGTVTTSGSKLTLTPAATAKGTMRIRYVATDVPQANRADHQAEGEVTVHLIGAPDAPTNVQPDRTVLSQTVKLSWTAPAANGTPISNYIVTDNRGGRRDCGRAPSCTVGGLKNGVAYTFTVVAKNAIDESKPSAPSRPATPDAVPTAVRGFTASNPQDNQLTLRWTPLSGEFSRVLRYRVSGGPSPQETTSASLLMRGLDNNRQYTFTIIAINEKGAGPRTVASGKRQSAGRPAAPQEVRVRYANESGTDSTKVAVSWTAVTGAEVEGPTPVRYALTRSPGGPVSTCGATATTCYDTPAAGQDYTYSVTARNGADAADPGRHTSNPKPSEPFEAAAKPAEVGNYSIRPTGDDGKAQLTFDAPKSNGKTSTVKCSFRGQSCGEWGGFSPAGEPGVSRPIEGLPNGESVDVELIDCNGSESDNNSARTCGEPVSRSVNAYGSPSVTVNPLPGSGRNARWTVSANGNGRPITVQVTSTRGYSNTYNSGRGSETSGEQTQDIDYENSMTVTARVTQQDASPAHNADDSDQVGSGPKPQVIVSKGRQDSSVGSCTSSACHHIHVELRNFQGTGGNPAYCTFNTNKTRPTDPDFPPDTVSYDGNGNGGRDVKDVYGYPGGQVTANCNGIDSNAATW